jgi:DNA-binding transcriptional LysR family regulator
MHLSQQAVSLQLKALTEATGLPLFTRPPQGMSLTADGAALLPLADKAPAALPDFGQAAAGLHTTVRGTQRISTILDPEFIRLRALFKQLMETSPQVGASCPKA